MLPEQIIPLVDAVYLIMSINKYLSAAIILVVYFILSKLVVLIIERIVLRFTAKTKTDVDTKIASYIQAPLSLIILLFGFKLFIIELWDAYAFFPILDNGISSLIVIVFIYTVGHVVNMLIDELGVSWARKTKSRLDSQLVRLLGQIVIVATFVIIAISVLSIWGVRVGPLLAGLGIGGLAIAFALQPTLANIFGGITLVLDKAIRVGDMVKLDSGESGTVYEIGLRSTRIKTFTNEILVIPNSRLVDSRVINYNQPDPIVRVDIPFGVAYGSKIDQVKKLALGCTKGVEHVLPEPAPSIIFNEMADSALQFTLRYHVDNLKYKWETHQKIIEKLYNTLNAKKISIPFPQRELWVHNLKK